MSSIVVEQTQFKLSAERLESILNQLTEALKGRVREAYVFGSASTGEIKSESDVDLILIKETCPKPFVQRAFEFLDLFEIYPKLDILVYEPQEFAAQMADSEVGFWRSVRLSLKRIV